MNSRNNTQISRRDVLSRAAGAFAFGSAANLLWCDARAQVGASHGVNTYSEPSELRITDMRACTIASNYDYPIIRIDTNQGVYGLGEVRDAGVKGLALVLKPHLLGKNPLRIEPLLDQIRKMAGHYRFGGGYSAVDMALHDIAGKVYGVPAWRLLGSKYRDKVRIYCDTTPSKDPRVYADRLLQTQSDGIHVPQDGFGNRSCGRPAGSGQCEWRGDGARVEVFV